LKYNNVMYASFDSNREEATMDLFEKFIAQPVYDEAQWKTLIAETTPPETGGSK
ncbi:TPA: phage tail protein, partial [Enterococcus faecium]|nr:phage tail protein [Enterococcus faecium]